MASLKFLAFAGSTRRESFNRKLLSAVVEEVRAAGAEVTVVDLGMLAIPLYNGDLEAESGLPEAVKQLVAQGVAHNGYIIASPEYNSSITPILKNTIDWMSRSDDDAFEGKVAVNHRSRRTLRRGAFSDARASDSFQYWYRRRSGPMHGDEGDRRV